MSLQILGPAVVSAGGSGACSQLLWSRECLSVALVAPAMKGGTGKGARAPQAPTYCCSKSFFCLIPALQMDPDFSSAFLTYQGCIHHPACLFNPIRAMFNWG